MAIPIQGSRDPRIRRAGTHDALAQDIKLLPTIVLALAAAAAATPAHAWTEHPVYTPVAGLNTSVTSVAVAGAGNAFYIVFELGIAATGDHWLYLQKWGGGGPWALPYELDHHVGAWIYNPSVATRNGHVTVTAHYDPGCGNDVVGLKEYDYDVNTAVVDKTRIIDSAAGCDTVGHSHLVYSVESSTYHACWTQKTGPAGTGDEVLCATRLDTAGMWSPAVNLSGGAPNGQDHATVAIKTGTNNTRRVAFHDQTNGSNDDNEARLFMDKPSGATVEYRVPQGTPVPQLGWQDRPFVALSGDNKMHVAWEDGLNNSEVIKYARCVNDTPDGCDATADWEFNNVAINDPGATRARFPHLTITGARTWISYEQPIGGRNQVMVLHRCLSAAYNAAWTITDPYTGLRDEYTEEYGTPHIASRIVLTPTVPLTPTGPFFTATVIVGAVSLRKQMGTPYYDAVLYEMTEPACL